MEKKSSPIGFHMNFHNYWLFSSSPVKAKLLRKEKKTTKFKNTVPMTYHLAKVNV